MNNVCVQRCVFSCKGVIISKGWFGQKTPWCWGGLDKRLLGVGVVWTKDSLVPGLNQHQGVFCPNHPSTKESFVQTTPLKENTKESFVQTTPTPRSLLSKPPPKTLKAISRSLRLAPRSHLSKLLQNFQIFQSLVNANEWKPLSRFVSVILTMF